MQMLTNEQRECFGLRPIEEGWECMEAKASPHDSFRTFLYLDGDRIVKCIQIGEASQQMLYYEREMSEKVSPDRKYLLPKTEKGKPALLSASSIGKRRGSGMYLRYSPDFVNLGNQNTDRFYYTNVYETPHIPDLSRFFRWVEDWCADTSASDKADVLAFSQQKRAHIRYEEGDVFRFKIGRRLYGYGRILLDYDKMRKRKEPFWDVLMTKPLVCSAYHILTERKDVSLEELRNLKSLPSTVLTDNPLFYGEYEIIGNIPVSDNEDYPIMYGDSISCEDAVYYQCGKFFRKLENEKELFSGFRMSGVSYHFKLSKHILKQCIAVGSNNPYWFLSPLYVTRNDLRNPANAGILQKVKKQFGL